MSDPEASKAANKQSEADSTTGEDSNKPDDSSSSMTSVSPKSAPAADTPGDAAAAGHDETAEDSSSSKDVGGGGGGRRRSAFEAIVSACNSARKFLGGDKVQAATTTTTTDVETEPSEKDDQVVEKGEASEAATLEVKTKNKETKETKKTKKNKENKENKENKAKSSSSKKKKDSVTSPSRKLTDYFSNLSVSNQREDAKVDDTAQDQQIKEADEAKADVAVSTSKTAAEGKPKRQRSRAKSIRESLNHTIDEYFPARRRDRRNKKEIELEREKELQGKIVEGLEDGLEVKEFEGKGRGVVTTRDFSKGEFVIEYIGDLIDGVTAKEREKEYAKDKDTGCYMYYFKHRNSQYCIDATAESGKLGRLINHSKKGNLTSRIIEIGTTPHLVLFAKTDIPSDTEVLYDYGDRNKESILHHPWLNL